MHIRTEIRHLIRDRLIARDIVGDRVKASQLRPFNKESFPAIWVSDYLDTGGNDIDQAVFPRQRNLLTIVAVGVDSGAAGEEIVEDTLDELAAEVERVMVGDGIITCGLQSQVETDDASQFVYDVTYIKTEKKPFTGGDRIVLTALIYYEIQYRGQV